MNFCRVLLPLRLNWHPTYSCEDDLRVGERVRLKFAGRSYMAVVLELGVDPDISPDRILPIESGVEGLPDISAEELRFWKFISEYYMCTMGEVYKAAYPSLKTDSEVILARKIAKGKAPAPLPAQLHLHSDACAKPMVLVGSGRLPLYENAIRSTLDCGRSVLVLVCETKQGDNLGRSLQKTFENSVMSFNCKLTPVRRRTVAQALREASRPALVIGTRSSLFLPFRDLGLIIVDEEQDTSYKQSDSSPRYNARDLALALAHIHDASSILGTCCPSLETAFNIRTGKYEKRELPFGNASVEIVDVAAELRKNGMRGLFSRKSIDASAACSSILIVRGWEKEDELRQQSAALFPSAQLSVLTQNAARLDNSLYDLVIVMQADAFFDSSDFRSDEHLLQLLCSLRERTRKLLVQTAKGQHPVFAALKGGDGEELLLKERKAFNLPPFVRMVEIDAGKYAEDFAKLLPVPCVKMGRILRISLPRSAAAGSIKQEITGLAASFEKRSKGKAHIYFNVDPQ